MSQATITGIITYRQRITLPANAAIALKLQDMSLQDTTATVLAATTFCSSGWQVPLPFALTYDRSQINPQHTYSVQVQIMVDEHLRFLNTLAYPVITRGNPTTIEVVVDPVS